MKIITKYYETINGSVEGVHLKWEGFALLLVTGKKGFLACGAFDLEAIGSFGAACAMVESTPENPIGTLERFPDRKIVAVNEKARQLGIAIGIDVNKAFALIA